MIWLTSRMWKHFHHCWLPAIEKNMWSYQKTMLLDTNNFCEKKNNLSHAGRDISSHISNILWIYMGYRHNILLINQILESGNSLCLKYPGNSTLKKWKGHFVACVSLAGELMVDIYFYPSLRAVVSASVHFLNKLLDFVIFKHYALRK